jgi:hypothetical protein
VATFLADGEEVIVFPGVCRELYMMWQRRKIGNAKRTDFKTRRNRGSINLDSVHALEFPWKTQGLNIIHNNK